MKRFIPPAIEWYTISPELLKTVRRDRDANKLGSRTSKARYITTVTSGPDLRGSTPKGGDSFGVVSTIATQKVPEKLTPEPEEAAPSLSKSKDLEPSGKKISLSKPDDRPASPLHRSTHPYNHIYMTAVHY